MKLLQEIDQRAKTLSFEKLLEDIKSLDPISMNDKTVTKIIHETLKVVVERGGDYEAHMDMAKGAGVKGDNIDPRVAQEFGSSLNLKGEGPAVGEMVKLNGVMWNVEESDGKIAFITKPGDRTGNGETIKVSNLVPIKNKKGGRSWLHMSPENGESSPPTGRHPRF